MSVVALTGCSGYIGSRLQRFLDDEDRVSRVIGIDVNPPGQASAKREFHRMDIRDKALSVLFKDRSVDKVVHLAFTLNPLHDEALMYDINVRGAANVLSAAAACGAEQLVFASSTTVFGASPDNPAWFSEEDPIRRYDEYYYPAHKYDVEMMLEDFTAERPAVKVAVVRPCFVVGPNTDNFISRSILRLPFIPGTRGARPEIQFVHEDDAAEVFMRVLEKNASGRFHATGEGTVNLSRIADIAGKRIVNLPLGFLNKTVDVLWNLHAPLVEGPSGMLNFIRYRWTVSDKLTRERLGMVTMRSSEEVLQLLLKSRGGKVRDSG